MMKTVKGDLIKRALNNEFDVIIHGCNCFCTMGSGIAKQIKEVWPKAFRADLETKKGDKTKLGTFTFAKVEVREKPLIIVNAYTQYTYWEPGVKADYEAIRQAFKSIKTRFTGMRIGYPAIGAGRAEGDWQIISAIIDKELAGEDHTFVEYIK